MRSIAIIIEMLIMTMIIKRLLMMSMRMPGG